MRKTLAFVTMLAVVLGLAVSSGPSAAQSAPPEPCGTTTLEATIELGPDGLLRCGPGQPLVVRTEFLGGDPNPERATDRSALGAFYAIADVQLADEESPARGEFADPCGPVPGVSSSAFRPQESMVIHLLNAHVNAATRVAASGGPVLGQPLDFVIGLGDLADNQQFNEIRWIIDILDGGQLIDPDTGDDPVLGGEGYDGVQGNEPEGANGRTLDPTGTGESVLDLANEPFWATGLNTSAGQVPWYSLPGNHDVKAQGTVPDELTGRSPQDMQAYRAAARAFVIGHLKFVHDAPPDQKQDLCEAFAAGDQDAFADAMQRMLTGDPSEQLTRRVIPSDPERMFLYRSQQIRSSGDEELCLAGAASSPVAQEICRSSWVDEHRHTSGVPIGHGFGTADDDSSPRCRDAEGNLLERACWAFDQGAFHYVGLDSNPPEGLEGGNIDAAQFEWLERELVANSSSYFDDDGNLVQNPDATDRLVVVFSHHTMASMDNQGLFTEGKRFDENCPCPATSDGRSGEELRDLLLRFPNVILHANGHTHENRVFARGADDDRSDTGYWEVNTSAIADRPHQSRVLEIADNHDGTLSIFGVVVDAAVPPNADAIDWDANDPTSETALGGAARNINEDWLASYGREVGYYDPQTDLTAIGEPGDRNVELLLRAPQWLPGAATVLTYTGDTSGQIGRRASVSAVLSTEDGTPIGGRTIVFSRGDHSAAAVTGPDGVAATALKISPPKGDSLPITVSFAGDDSFLPATIPVQFTALAGR